MDASSATGIGGEGPTRRGPLRTRRRRLGALGVLVLACGAGGFAISASLSSSSGTSAATPTPASGPSDQHRAPGLHPAGRLAGQFGTVRSTSSSGFVLATRTGGDLTVRVSSSTTYVEAGVSKPSLSDVKVGVTVSVSGATSSGVLVATRVTIGGRGGRGGFGGGFGNGQRPVAFGTVHSVAEHSFVLASRTGGNVTVSVSASTTYRDGTAANASYATVKKGASVVVFGTTAASGSINATSVLVGNFGGGFGGRPAGGGPS